jgi:hypothetical protein
MTLYHLFHHNVSARPIQPGSAPAAVRPRAGQLSDASPDGSVRRSQQCIHFFAGLLATPLARVPLSRRFPPRLVDSMLQHLLRMSRCPPVGKQPLQLRFTRAQVQQDVANIHPRLQAMTLRSRQDCKQHRRSRSCLRTAEELPGRNWCQRAELVSVLFPTTS